MRLHLVPGFEEFLAGQTGSIGVGVRGLLPLKSMNFSAGQTACGAHREAFLGPATQNSSNYRGPFSE